MDRSSLAGYSILVVEDEPFIAHCLQIVLEGAGAEIHRAAGAREAWHFADQGELSAAILDCKHGIRGDHTIARRLQERGLPFVLYGARELSRYEAWPNAPVMGKLVSGAEIVATLHGLLQPRNSSGSAAGEIVGATAGTEAAQTPAMAGVEALMKRRRITRRSPRQSTL